MATLAEQETMREIQTVVNKWNMNTIPAWRAIEKIAALVLEHQKAEYKREHQ